ncbi:MULTISPECIES: carboxypeptidase-like regulatory domain-containing protein [unclassified Saccharothrix]|uniref:carboxypeptidase-like regulatory domain-containing protein n=1 Tax=unclassified Saccharothrix TaxID=2593673 RepID=UPI00307DB852
MARLRLPGVVAAMLALSLGVPAGPAQAQDPPTSASTTTTTSTTTTATTTPSIPAEAVEPYFDLRVTAAFDRPVYEADEIITARATVTNVGTDAEQRIRVISEGNFSTSEWRDFGGPGVTSFDLEPGESVSGSATGYATTAATTLSLLVKVQAGRGDDANPADNQVTITVPITVVRGDLTGTAYRDADLDGVVDGGETLPDTEVTATGGRPYETHRTRTDAQGRFAFRDLPRGPYSVSVADDEAWLHGVVSADVGTGSTPDLVVRGLRRLSTVVATTVSFDQDTRRQGDTARLTVSLTNSGPTLSGIVAVSYTDGGSVGVDLGELSTGTTLPTGQTRVFTAQVPIDATMADSGYLRVRMSIVSREIPIGNIDREVLLRVTGARAPRVVGRVAESPAGNLKPDPRAPLPNAVVYLRDQISGAVVERTTTDAAGHFEFTDVPAGLYHFGAVGPWRVLVGRHFPVRGSEDPAVTSHLVVVVRGPDQPDPGYPPADPAPPAAGPESPDGALAATGTDPTWLALGGLLALAIGGALLFTTRRRTT